MMGRGKAVYLELIQKKKTALFGRTALWVLLLLLSGVFLFSNTKEAMIFLVLGAIAFIWNIVERGEIRKTLDKRGDRARFYSEIETLKEPRAYMKWRFLVLEHYVMAAQNKLQLFTYDELSGVEVVTENSGATAKRVLYVTLKMDGSKVAMVKWKEQEPGADALEEAASEIWHHIEEQSN